MSRSSFCLRSDDAMLRKLGSSKKADAQAEEGVASLAIGEAAGALHEDAGEKAVVLVMEELMEVLEDYWEKG